MRCHGNVRTEVREVESAPKGMSSHKKKSFTTALSWQLEKICSTGNVRESSGMICSDESTYGIDVE